MLVEPKYMKEIKMDIKLIVLERVIKWLVGGEAFKIITGLVGSLMDQDKTNDDKRNEVRDIVMPILSSVGKFILNTAIAFAVDKAKAELAK